MVRKRSRTEKISEGEYAFEEGKPGETMILLDMGTLKLTENRPKRARSKELVQSETGTSVAEMSLIDQALRSALEGGDGKIG